MAVSNYTFDFDLGLFALVLVGLAIGFIALTFPYRMMTLTFANCRRADGQRSGRRTKKEVRKLIELLGELLLFPILGTAFITAAVLIVHTFVIPIPLVVDVMGMFSPDGTVWEERTETGELGDVGRLYGEWSDEQGFSQERAYGIRKFLKRNWLVLLLLATAITAVAYVFITGYYVSCLKSYHDGLLMRKKRYAEHDSPS